MDGLASLAAAADLVGFADVQQSSPMKRKLSQQAPRTPTRTKKKREGDTPDVERQHFESDMAHPSPVIEIAQSSRGDPLAEKIIRTLNPSARLWCAREFFYSSLDRDYFHENEFLSCLHQIGLGKVTKLTRANWTRARSVMGSRIGRPRRFSPAFLRGEREKLHRYRRTVRGLHIASSRGGRVVPPPAQEFPYQVYEPVAVGDIVSALHLPSCSIERGQVLAVSCWSELRIAYLVQFDQVELGHGVVSDDMIASHGPPQVLHRRRRVAELQAVEAGGRSGISGGGAGGAEENCQSDRFFQSLEQEGLAGQLRVDTSDVSTPLEEVLEGLWWRCMREAEKFVLISRQSRRKQQPQDAAPQSSDTSTETLTAEDMMGVPCVACLLFIRLQEKEDVLASHMHSAGAAGLSGEVNADADAAVSSFLGKKIGKYYDPSHEMSRTLCLLFGLANSLSHRGRFSSRTLLQQTQLQHQQHRGLPPHPS